MVAICQAAPIHSYKDQNNLDWEEEDENMEVAQDTDGDMAFTLLWKYYSLRGFQERISQLLQMQKYIIKNYLDFI